MMSSASLRRLDLLHIIHTRLFSSLGFGISARPLSALDVPAAKGMTPEQTYGSFTYKILRMYADSLKKHDMKWSRNKSELITQIRSEWGIKEDPYVEQGTSTGMLNRSEINRAAMH